MKRNAKIERKTNETDIKLSLDVDGKGVRSIDTPIGFLNHMLDLFCKQGLFDIELLARGDTYVDEHHIVEDIGIVLGEALKKALGNKKGIVRYGFFVLLMDESIATTAVDLSGRSSFKMECEFKREKIGDLPTELVYDFFEAFAFNARINLFVRVENGRNDHHKIEAIFKSIARSIRMAVEVDKRSRLLIPSTKGVL